jgi:hypothetical protein
VAVNNAVAKNFRVGDGGCADVVAGLPICAALNTAAFREVEAEAVVNVVAVPLERLGRPIQVAA